MGEVINISTSSRYDNSSLQKKKLIGIARALKRDIGKLVKLSQSELESERNNNLIQKYKSRIFSRLEEVGGIRISIKNENEPQWNTVLTEILKDVHKHRASETIDKKVVNLLNEDRKDISETGIHFLIAYMKIVARIPEDQINLPFKG